MKYVNILASLQAAKNIRDWIILVLSILIVIEGIVIQRMANTETPVAVVPGATAGIYTPGEIPQDVIFQNLELFVNNLTNYNRTTFAKNMNASIRMMTSKCRAQKMPDIELWKKEIEKFELSKSFYPKGQAKVISEKPYILEYKGEFDVRTSAGTVVQHGVKTVRILVVSKPRTRSNLLGYGIDDWEITDIESKK